jgi:hypothetical protein
MVIHHIFVGVNIDIGKDQPGDHANDQRDGELLEDVYVMGAEQSGTPVLFLEPAPIVLIAHAGQKLRELYHRWSGGKWPLLRLDKVPRQAWAKLTSHRGFVTITGSLIAEIPGLFAPVRRLLTGQGRDQPCWLS